MTDLPGLVMRWLHLASAATLTGGLLFAWLAMARATAGLAKDVGQDVSDRAAANFRPLVIAATIGLLLSGIYNILSAPGHTRLHQIVLVVKLLLAAHVMSAAILSARPHNPRRTRQVAGAAISALIIIFLSTWLRRNF
jgi:hypothetical protein